MNMKPIRMLAWSGAIVLALTACGSDDDDEPVPSYTGGTGGATGGTGGADGGTGGADGGTGGADGGTGGADGGTGGADGGTGGGGPAAEVVDCAQTTAAITIAAMLPNFDPASASVSAGDVVRFESADTLPHTATSGSGTTPDGLWDTGTIPQGGAACVQFNTAGTYPYYCIFHPDTMQASITVQ